MDLGRRPEGNGTLVTRTVDSADMATRDPHKERPVDESLYHTADLPDTPQRDRVILAQSWVEAPAGLDHLGADFGETLVGYKRRIHGWLLWRAGPPSRGDARYVAIDAGSLDRSFEFRLYPDGTGEGEGPSGKRHERFRSWKEDLRDHPVE